MTRQGQPGAESLAGLVGRVAFRNPDNGFRVPRTKARGQRDLTSVIGHAALIAAGESVLAAGSRTRDQDMIHGMGPGYAKRPVRACGEAASDVIEQAPDRVREVAGSRPGRAERIVAGRAERKVALRLQAHGPNRPGLDRRLGPDGPAAMPGRGCGFPNG